MWASLQLLALLATSSFAATTTSLSSSTATVQVCATSSACTSWKGAIPTLSSTKTSTVRNTVSSTSIPIKTVTPPATTTTVVSTSLQTFTSTGKASTQTITTTINSTVGTTDTQTITTFITDTITETASTTDTTTSHVPTAPGFRGIEETSGDTDGDGPQKRGIKGVPGGSLLRRAVAPDACTPKYPSSVTCTKTITITITKRVIVIKPTSTTTAQRPTSTKTSIVTSTTTSTVVPPNQTSTVSVTNTITSNSETTIIATSTAPDSTTTITPTSTATYYDYCAPTNILGPQLVNGSYLSPRFYYGDSGQPPNGATVAQQQSDSAYDCCVACFTQIDNCQFSRYTDSTGVCVTVGQDDRFGYCNPGQQNDEVANFFLSDTEQGGVYYSNGCGYLEEYSGFLDANNPF